MIHAVETHITRELARNLADVRERIARAALVAGRRPEDIQLIAVSKTKPLAMIRAAFAAGQRIFGENYVQEAVAKVAAFAEAEWHFIGGLQTNKVKPITGRFALIHSVDRERLADELEKAAAKAGVVQDILLQVHVGSEASKSGVSMDEAPALIERIAGHSHLRLRGLMSLPPLTEDERVGRGYFASLREALEKWRRLLPTDQAARFGELSMGTSSDYEWAILEGATYVRVGTAIFGARGD